MARTFSQTGLWLGPCHLQIGSARLGLLPHPNPAGARRRESPIAGCVCQVVEKPDVIIRRLTRTSYAAIVTAATWGISCHPSIFRTLM
jgi:hypothetical protein